jgi:hypothetical protein
MPRKKITPALDGTKLPLGPVTVGFRLQDETSRRLLMEQAARLKISEHSLARDYVMEMIYDHGEREALRETVSLLHREIGELRKDLVVVAEALLTSAGKVKDGDAREWVGENLRSE